MALPDYLQALRFSSIFDPQGVNSTAQDPRNPWSNINFAPTPQDTDLDNTPPPDYNIGNRMDELYKPSTGAMDQYNQHLSSIPQRQEPGAFRKIAAVMSGMGAGKPVGMWGGVPVGWQSNPAEQQYAQEQALYPGYNRQMGDWAFKERALQQRAALEEQKNKMNQSDALNQIGKEIQERKNADISAYYKGRLGINQQAQDTAKARLKLDEMKQANPKMTFRDIKGGNIIGIDPQTGKTMDTGISSGSLTDADKIKLGVQGRLSFFNQTEPVRQQNRLDVADVVTQRQKANQEAVAKRAAIPKKTTTTISPDNKTKVSTTEQVAPTAISKATMKAPDGKTYSIDSKEVEEAKKHGWTVVQ